MQYFPNIQSVGLLLTLVALGISSCHLMEARKQRISAEEAMREASAANNSATESVKEVKTVAAQVQAAEGKIEGLLAQAQAVEQHILEIEERAILRVWINILPDGSELMHPVTGARPSKEGRRYVIDPQFGAKQPFQQKLGGGWTWACDDENLQNLTWFIKGLPRVPYASVARADCLKKRGDPSLKDDADRAKILLEKMRALQPHPMEIDEFYSICLSLLQAT